MDTKLFVWKSSLDYVPPDRPSRNVTLEALTCRKELSLAGEEERFSAILSDPRSVNKHYTISDVVINSYDCDLIRVGCERRVITGAHNGVVGSVGCESGLVEDYDPKNPTITSQGLLANPLLLASLRKAGFDIANHFIPDGGDYRISSELIDSITKGQLYTILSSEYVSSVDVMVKEIPSTTQNRYMQQHFFEKLVLEGNEGSDYKCKTDSSFLLNLLKLSHQNIPRGARKNEHNSSVVEPLATILRERMVFNSYEIGGISINPQYECMEKLDFDNSVRINDEQGRTLFCPQIEEMLAKLGYDQNRGVEVMEAGQNWFPGNTLTRPAASCKYKLVGDGISRMTVSDLVNILQNLAVHRVVIKLNQN